MKKATDFKIGAIYYNPKLDKRYKCIRINEDKGYITFRCLFSTAQSDMSAMGLYLCQLDNFKEEK